MNTGGRNIHGRTVFQGPRGGRYVMIGTRKVYKFQLAPAAAGAAAGPVVPRNIHGRHIHTGPRGGRYVIIHGRKVYKFEEAPAAPPAPPPPPGSPPGPAGTIRVPGTRYYIHKNGRIVTRTNEPVMLSGPNRVKYYRNVFNNDPNHLHNRVLPFKNTTTNPFLLKSNLRAKPTRASLYGYPTMEVPVFFDRTTGNLFYVRQNNQRVHVQSDAATHYGIQVRTNATLRQMKQQIEAMNARYPRSGRSNAELLNLMVNRIYGGGGRAGTINVSNLTANEKRRVAERLRGQVTSAILLRNQKQREANQARTRGNAAAAAAASERVGYYNNISRAMRRGLRAVEPLSGRITGGRIMAATPNRWTPGGPNETNVVMMENLERPHIVIKVPGTQVLYMNPDSLIGMIKNGTGANVARANLRNWLRMARRNFPNEPLFRHYISRNKNVMPKHIRFSSA